MGEDPAKIHRWLGRRRTDQIDLSAGPDSVQQAIPGRKQAFGSYAVAALRVQTATDVAIGG